MTTEVSPWPNLRSFMANPRCAICGLQNGIVTCIDGKQIVRAHKACFDTAKKSAAAPAAKPATKKR